MRRGAGAPLDGLDDSARADAIGQPPAASPALPQARISVRPHQVGSERSPATWSTSTTSYRHPRRGVPEPAAAKAVAPLRRDRLPPREGAADAFGDAGARSATAPGSRPASRPPRRDPWSPTLRVHPRELGGPRRAPSARRPSASMRRPKRVPTWATRPRMLSRPPSRRRLPPSTGPRLPPPRRSSAWRRSLDTVHEPERRVDRVVLGLAAVPRANRSGASRARRGPTTSSRIAAASPEPPGRGTRPRRDE